MKTKSIGKRNVLLLSTLKPFQLLAAPVIMEKKPKFIKFMTLQKEGQILQIKELSITLAKLKAKDGQLQHFHIFSTVG